LVQAVGPAWAKQILFSANLFDAATALRIGLVNETHPLDSFDERVSELAGRIASRARVSVHGAKQIVNRINTGQSAEDDEVRALHDAAVLSTDYTEGVEAFLAKRDPKF
jgi:enoyl-CoA hydratase/carnithine racemase